MYRCPRVPLLRHPPGHHRPRAPSGGRHGPEATISCSQSNVQACVHNHLGLLFIVLLHKRIFESVFLTIFVRIYARCCPCTSSWCSIRGTCRFIFGLSFGNENTGSSTLANRLRLVHEELQVQPHLSNATVLKQVYISGGCTVMNDGNEVPSSSRKPYLFSESHRSLLLSQWDCRIMSFYKRAHSALFWSTTRSNLSG